MSDAASKPRRPWVAFILSLVMPGLGQFYCGRWIAASLFYLPLLALVFVYRIAAALGMPAGYAWMIPGAAILLSAAAAIEAAWSARRLAGYKPGTFNHWYFYIPALLWNVVVILGLANITAYNVPTGSMSPTVMLGDGILTWSYGWPPVPPARCDVAVFIHTEQGSRIAYIKRVVGLEGDRIAYQGGRLVINGSTVNRDKIAVTENGTTYRETLPGGCSYLIQEQSDGLALDNTDTFVVPSGAAFVLGDNRDDSADSRISMIGYVPLEKFRGRVFVIYKARDPARVGFLRH